jgi:hypothetical protein
VRGVSARTIIFVVMGICISAEGVWYIVRPRPTPFARGRESAGTSWWTRPMSPRGFRVLGAVLLAFGVFWLVIAFV